MAGNILGAIYGYEAIPARWLESLELRDLLLKVADDMAECVQWCRASDGSREDVPQRILRDYPPFMVSGVCSGTGPERRSV